MKKRINAQKMIKMAYKETKRSSLAIYLILRFLVVICMILQVIRGDLNNALLCLLSLVLLFAPLFIQNKYEITLPDSLEISIYLFIFSAEILGEINNFLWNYSSLGYLLTYYKWIFSYSSWFFFSRFIK